MSTTVPATAPNLGVRVLSLDGGGIGTLSELLILDRMMYRIQTELRRDAKPSPCEYFELIGGSGTGGIVALMLGRLRMSIDEAISAYEKLWPQSQFGVTEEFQATAFAEALKDIFKQEPLKDFRPDACKTFVCAMNAVNMNGGRPELFRTYDTMDEPAGDCLLWEAARATSATPGLFKAVEIGLGAMKQRYISGGVGHNNPTSLVLAEAEDIYPSRPVVFMASIGSGHSATIHIPNSLNPRDIAKPMKDITLDCEETHEANATRFRGLPDTYFRFNVRQGMQGLALHDWETSNEVSAHTRNYLSAQDVKEKLSGAVKVLLNPVIRVSAYPKICPAPSVRFTGRGGILEKMTEYFNRDIGRRHIFLLHGLGGSGKSQVAFKFVEQSESCFSDIYFVDCSSQQTLENDLITLALYNKLGKSPDDSLLWLSHQRKKWLIVFNNADDTHLNLVRYFPSGHHGNILITSCNHDLRQHADMEYKVDRMEVHEAAELLLSTARYEMTEAENEEIAKRLVQRLHCLPLAVAQAGAYIASSRCLDQYLELYESTAQQIQLLNNRPVQSDYEWSVYTTWQISFKELSPLAAELLQLCSFIHHSGITEEIFRQAASYKFTAEEETQLREPLKFLAHLLSSSMKWDSLKFMALTTELGGYSLIEFEAGSGAITFSIHPLVHEWCRTTLESETPTELCMHKLVGMSVSATKKFRFGHLVLPHLDVLLFKGTEDSIREPNVLDLAFAEEYLRVYDKEGRWNDGMKLGNAMLQMATPELQEHQALWIQYSLAGMYREHGHFDEARTLGEQVSSRLTELVGEHDPDTLTSMGDLALTYRGLGQFKNAEGLQHKVLNKTIEILGDDRPRTVVAMENLALMYSDLGQLKEAEELKARVLNKNREILGPNHPDTLLAMGNLAGTYSALGQFKQAEVLEQAVLNMRRGILGDDHPHTLLAMGNLAHTYAKLGQFKQAEELEQTVLNMRREILGEEHPDTMMAMGNLASTYSALGQFKQAEELEQTVLNMHREILGDDHPHTLLAMGNLAHTYLGLGQFKQAEELEQTVLNMHREILGDHHPHTLLAMGNLARTYSALGQFKQAEALEQTVLNMRREILGEEHPDTLLVMGNLARTYSALGQFKQAEELEQTVLNMHREILGEEHTETLRAMANLAATYSELGQFKQAEELEKTVLNMRREILGEEHPDTLLAMGNLASTYSDLGQFKQAEELKQTVLKMRREILGEEHPDTLEAMANLAVTYWKLGQFQEAEELETKVLNKRREILGPNHPDTLLAMENLAATYSDLGRSKEAEELKDAVADIRRKAAGEEHPQDSS